MLDQLVALCEQTFANEEPKTWEFQKLLTFIGELNVDNLGLRKRCEGMSKDCGWDFENLHESENLYIKLLIIPANGQIPLHDHPEMSGIVKTIWGSMEYTSYDWAREYPYSGLARRRAHTRVDGASGPDLLLPHWKNIHTMKALEDCAFIDIFSPHYYNDENRKCTYYAVDREIRNHEENLYLLKISE